MAKDEVKTRFVIEGIAEAGPKIEGFKRSLGTTATALRSVDAELNKTIAASNKLGDSSATVARRYEKLGEGIALQNLRLRESAAAYAAGEINAKKYASVLASVETQTQSLAGRIRDANARIGELQDTGLTHFQNQIQGAITSPQAGGVTGQQGGIAGFFRNLSSYQKRQLSFQANDVISGLAMGQSPMQILAQQGGQILQIFQMGKLNAQATATAAAAAATSEAALATSAGVVATESTVTAAAMTEAAAASTVMGVALAPLVAIGVEVAAMAVALGVVFTTSKQIRTEAENRLKTEEKVTGELNKQYQAAGALKQRLASEAGERAFNRFVGGDDIAGMQRRVAELQRQRDANSAANILAASNRAELVGGNKFYDEKFTPAAHIDLKAAEDEISKLTARIDEIRQASVQKSIDFIGDIQKHQLENQANETKAAEQAQKDALDRLTRTRTQQNTINENYYKVQEARAAASGGDEIQSIIAVQRVHRQQIQQQLAEVETYYAKAAKFASSRDEADKLAGAAAIERSRLQTDLQLSAIEAERRIAAEREKAAEKAKREAEQLQKAIVGIFDSVTGGTGNPYIKFLADAEKFSRSLLEVTKGLTAEQKDFLQAQNDANITEQRSQQRANTTVEAFGLRTQARDFRRGYRLEGNAAILERNEDLSGLFNQLRRNNISQEARDRQIIAATNGIDPRDLFRGNSDIAAGAREREARRIEQQEKNADDYFTKMVKLLTDKGLKIDLGNQTVTTVEVNSKILDVTKRDSTPGPVKTTAGAMGAPTTLRTGGFNTFKTLQ